jgi:hypothetical protein
MPVLIAFAAYGLDRIFTVNNKRRTIKSLCKIESWGHVARKSRLPFEGAFLNGRLLSCF